MRRLNCPEGQDHLFPLDVMKTLAGHPREKVELPPLPIAENQEIDVRRAARMLDTTLSSVRRMLAAGMIRSTQIGVGTPRHRIDYWSVVEYCDKLRLTYLLPARKPTPAGRRVPDDEVLPFRRKDAMSQAEVASYLRIKPDSVLHLLQEGKLDGYQLFPGPFRPWRISRASVANYVRNLGPAPQLPRSA